ncbi:unnamed protein product, partial [marine sediment metagenome]
MRNDNRPFRIAGPTLSLVVALSYAPVVQAASSWTSSLAANDWQRVIDESWQPLQPLKSDQATTHAAEWGKARAPSAGAAMALAQVQSAPAPGTGSALAPTVLPADQAVSSFDLVADVPAQTQLEGWAKRAGWKVLWNVPSSNMVPGGLSYGTDFATAVRAVVEDMAANGADIYIDVWKRNKTV